MTNLIPCFDYYISMSVQQKRLFPIKRIINFVIAAVNREEYFSGPL
jgi:hypothetical protein